MWFADLNRSKVCRILTVSTASMLRDTHKYFVGINFSSITQQLVGLPAASP